MEFCHQIFPDYDIEGLIAKELREKSRERPRMTAAQRRSLLPWEVRPKQSRCSVNFADQVRIGRPETSQAESLLGEASATNQGCGVEAVGANACTDPRHLRETELRSAVQLMLTLRSVDQI